MRISPLIGLSLLALAAGCSQETVPRQSTPDTPAESPFRGANESDSASVRVVAAVPGGRPLDISANGEVVFTRLPYRAVTEYRTVPERRFTFRVRPSDPAASELLAEASKGLSGGTHYTLVAYDKSDGKAELAVFTDDLTPPGDGKAKVRFIDAAPEIGSVDVYAIGRDKLFSGLASGTCANSEVEPIEGTLQIRPQGQRTALLSLDNMHFDAGGIYTIVVVGHFEGSPRLAAIRIEDRVLGTPSAELQ